jgi:hypothetical protein
MGLFLPGHDKIAESAVLLIKYGGVPQLLARHGDAPGGINSRGAFEGWRSRVKTGRSEVK